MIPIIQSTTFKYDTSEDMGKLFDLEAEGYLPLLYAYSGGSAEDLRAYLAALYAEPGSLEGAILIGDLPHVV